MKKSVLNVLVVGFALGAIATASANDVGSFYGECSTNDPNQKVNLGLVKNLNGDCFAVEHNCGPGINAVSAVFLDESENAIEIFYEAAVSQDDYCDSENVIYEGQGWAGSCFFGNGSKFTLRVNPVKAKFCIVE